MEYLLIAILCAFLTYLSLALYLMLKEEKKQKEKINKMLDSINNILDKVSNIGKNNEKK